MLNQKIRDTIKQLRTALPSELNTLIEMGAGEISALDIIEHAKKPGDHMPDFTLTNQYGQTRSLRDYLDKGPLVITFYRGVWCPYCNLQLKAYSDRLPEIEATGASLIAITPEKPDALSLLRTNGAAPELTAGAVENTPFEILQDDNNVLASAMGLVFQLPESHQTVLHSLGLDFELVTGNTSYTFPDPATYLIDTAGGITWAFVPNNYRKRAEVDQILTALSAI